MAACPSCGQAGMRKFYRQTGIPSHSVMLLSDREHACSFPLGEIELAFCSGCGFIANIAVDESLRAYSSQCEETQGCSPQFQSFLEDLAGRLIERHDLRGKRVLEIGCGKAEFLELLCRQGGVTGIGIDPAVMPERVDPRVADRIELIEDYWSDRYAHLSGDFVVCRHTLEHVPRTGDFVRLLRRTLAEVPGAAVFFELPDVLRVLRETAFWDIYYEHCSYFSPGSLARLFRASGFEVTLLELDYGDQYILLEARLVADAASMPALSLEEPVDRIAQDVADFERRAAEALVGWRKRLEALRRDGRRVALWGSGSKGVSFLTTLGVEDEVESVVDINPRKQGKFMAGTGHEILAPEALRSRPPDVVIVMNPVYREEIGATLGSLGLSPELMAL